MTPWDLTGGAGQGLGKVLGKGKGGKGWMKSCLLPALVSSQAMNRKSGGFRLIALLAEGLVALPEGTLPQGVCVGAVGSSNRAARCVHTPVPQDTCSSWVYGRRNCKLLACAAPQAAAEAKCQTCHGPAAQGCSHARLSFTGIKNMPDFYTVP